MISQLFKLTACGLLLLINGLAIAGDKTIDGGAGDNTLLITASDVNDLSYFPNIKE